MQTALPPAAAPARPASEVAGPQMSCAVCPFRLRTHTLDCSLLSCLPFFFFLPSSAYFLCEPSLLHVGTNPPPLGPQGGSPPSLLSTYFPSALRLREWLTHLSLSLDVSSLEKVAVHNSVFKNVTEKCICKKAHKV